VWAPRNASKNVGRKSRAGKDTVIQGYPITECKS
jgi:hypothetical protein